jgi:hypothetical protein
MKNSSIDRPAAADGSGNVEQVTVSHQVRSCTTRLLRISRLAAAFTSKARLTGGVELLNRSRVSHDVHRHSAKIDQA